MTRQPSLPLTLPTGLPAPEPMPENNSELPLTETLNRFSMASCLSNQSYSPRPNTLF